MGEAWLNTVRLARDCGDISSLFPAGITRLTDLPYTLFEAIRLALHFLSFEEVPEPQDRPPKHIWLDHERMTQWWKDVRAAQEARAKGEPAVRDMAENELLAQMLGRTRG